MEAKRDKILPPYYLIPFVALKELAMRFHKGIHYGRDNWKIGGTKYREDSYSHAFEHMQKYNEGDESEDTRIENCAAVMWWAATEIWHLHEDSKKNQDRWTPLPDKID